MASKMIPPAECDHIKHDYAFICNASDFEMPEECRAYGDWQCGYNQDCGFKYDVIIIIMVSHSMHAWRHLTFDELYGDAVIG